jgi:amidohydrolase
MDTLTADRVKSLADKYFEEVRDIRRHIHANPELSFEEFETAKFISARLTEWGIEHDTGVCETGTVAYVSGQGEGPVVALRADIDALPILEQSDKSYASINKGVMHACGHDVHTACALGALKILHDTREEWSGTLKVIFQPGEEKLPGGASLMIKEGVLKNPDVELIIGQHVFTDLPAGQVGFKEGMYMASADEIYLTVKGKGGHAAMPHKTIDPILISAHILTALQQVVSRHASPITPSVLSFGKIIGEGATNVIPSEVKLEGTFRTFDEEWRTAAHEQITRIAEHTAQAMGGTCEVDIHVGYPFLKNDVPLTARCRSHAQQYLGETNVVELPLRMTAEDFSYYSQVSPACFYRLGTTTPEGTLNSPVHTSTFDIDEEALKTGMGLMAFLALSELGT